MSVYTSQSHFSDYTVAGGGDLDTSSNSVAESSLTALVAQVPANPIHKPEAIGNHSGLFLSTLPHSAN
jgi:hypothetical protein